MVQSSKNQYCLVEEREDTFYAVFNFGSAHLTKYPKWFTAYDTCKKIYKKKQHQKFYSSNTEIQWSFYYDWCLYIQMFILCKKNWYTWINKTQPNSLMNPAWLQYLICKGHLKKDYHDTNKMQWYIFTKKRNKIKNIIKYSHSIHYDANVNNIITCY